MEARSGNGSSYYQDYPDFNQRLANGLGWFSIGLGLAELVAPDRVADLIGAQDDDRTKSLLRFYGLRELTAGLGILSQPRSGGWMWSRVGGDLLDLASLAALLGSPGADRSKAGIATAAVLGVTALDVICAQQLSRDSATGTRDRWRRVIKSVVINRPIEDVYRYWRNFQNFPALMQHLESIEITGDLTSHWKAKAPAGMTVEWDAEILEDWPNERISWRSMEGSAVQNSGSVTFERMPGERGTIVRVALEYAPPGGAISATVAKLFGEEPEQQVDEDLRAFKQIMETGEVVHSEASIHRRMHPAQPPLVGLATEGVTGMAYQSSERTEGRFNR